MSESLGASNSGRIKNGCKSKGQLYLSARRCVKATILRRAFRATSCGFVDRIVSNEKMIHEITRTNLDKYGARSFQGGLNFKGDS